MVTTIPKNSVWCAMSYHPPRGRCNYKASLMSPACSCLRFMLHPVKAATSFECDGCQHHASFHSLENADEDAVLRKWEAQEASSGNSNSMQKQAIAGANKKRKRIADKAHDEEEEGLGRIIELSDATNGTVETEVEEQLHEELVGARKKRGRKGAV